MNVMDEEVQSIMLKGILTIVCIAGAGGAVASVVKKLFF